MGCAAVQCGKNVRIFQKFKTARRHIPEVKASETIFTYLEFYNIREFPKRNLKKTRDNTGSVRIT